VAENIVFGLRVRDVPVRERAARLAKVAAAARLAKLLERSRRSSRADSSSASRWGAAIIAETPVCLMDEPLSTSMRSCGRKCAARSALCSRSWHHDGLRHP